MRHAFALLVCSLAPLAAQEASRLTLEKLFHPQQKVNYLGTPSVQRSWLADGSLLENRKGELSRLDAATGKSEPLLGVAALKATILKAGASEAAAKTASEGGPGTWTPAMDAFLLVIEKDFYLVTPKDATARRLTTDGAPKDGPSFSPDGQRLAFLRGNDLYALELADCKETRLTTGGSETRLNGRFDWVYEEELYDRGNPRAFWWSPDSRRLAYLSFDTSRVPVHMLLDDRSQPQKQLPVRYPKAGDPNSDVKLGIVDLAGNTAWMDAPHPGQETLFSRVGWDPKGRLIAACQDRIQTWLELRRFEGTASRVLLKESSPAWQDVLPLPHFLPDGGFLWLSDRTGFRHLYRCDAEGKVLRAITEGAWDVRTLHGVDAKCGKVFFSGTQRSPIGLDAFCVALEGKTANAKLTLLTEAPGTHTATFDKGLTRFLDRWSSADAPSRLQLRSVEGQVLPLAEDAIPEAFKTLRLGAVKFQQVKNRRGTALETMLVLPPDFDATKKYPVFQEIYGGPHAPTVRNAFGRLWWHFLAQQGIVVWVCDNASASNKGPASAYVAYRKLGLTELEDQQDGLAWLKAQGWADMDRVIVDGWSYGGFMSALMMTKGKGWKAGIVGAPVTDFRLYDSIYTERYLGLPKDNPEGYDATNLNKVAKDLNGSLLLFHGPLDDNVHPQNTVQFIDALQKAGKDFELVLLPGAGHSPRSPEQTWFRYRKMWEFLKRNIQ